MRQSAYPNLNNIKYFKSCAVLLVIGLSLLSVKKVTAPTMVLAQAVNVPNSTVENATTSQPTIVPSGTSPQSPTSSFDLKTLIKEKALKYGVSAEIMQKVVNCESNGSTTIQSNYYWKGKREESYGLSQINLPHHPNITYSQATDADFSIDFLASELAQGHGYLWTCFRLLQ